MYLTYKSAIFAGILLLIAIFFIGFRAGQHIERIDKTYIPVPTSFVPIPANNLTPTSSLKETDPTNYSRISVKECRISFVLPSSFKPLPKSPNEAEFQSETEHVLVNCDQAFVQQQKQLLTDDSSVLKTPLVVTDRENVATQTPVITETTPLVYKTKTSSIFIQRNTQRKLVLIEVPLSLAYLIEETMLLD